MAGVDDAVVHDSVVAVDVVGHADDRNPPRGLLHRSNGGVPERHDKVDVACYKFARECGHSLDAHVGPNEIVADVMPLYPTCRLHVTSERPGE